MSRLAEVDRELLRRVSNPLHTLVRLAWPVVEAGPFVDNWHIGAICEHLEAVSKGQIRDLVINVPPGTLKSKLTGLYWPVWDWLSRPDRRWIYASYDAGLVRREGAGIIRLLQSQWWKERWPELALKETKPSTGNFEVSGGGSRFATSVEGKATGWHAHVAVVDDPIKPRDIGESAMLTRKKINGVSTWWRETMSTRRADPSTFARCIIMQRLHEDDLAGEMLREQGWTHLCLPMRFDPAQARTTPLGQPDKRTTEGELLFPARFPEQTVAELEIGLGVSAASAQLQQSPTPKGGGVFKREWFRYWHYRPNVRTPSDEHYPCRDEFCTVLPDSGVHWQSWDMTFKGSDGSDFVAGQLWLGAGVNCYLTHQVNKRLAFVEALQALLGMTQVQPLAATKLIEDKANGPAVENVLCERVSGIVLVNPQGGKVARANAVTGLWHAGNVYLPHPEIAPWVIPFRKQVVAFPRSVNDDMVDAMSQALLWWQLQHGSQYIGALQALQERLK